MTRDAPAHPRVHLEEATLELLPSRAAWWPDARTLLVSDLHLGKSERHRAAGAPIPAGLNTEQLDRLAHAARAVAAARILIVGDLLDAPSGITPELVDRVGAWRDTIVDIRIAVTPGNHDRRLAEVADTWDIDVLPLVHAEPGLAVTHIPPGETGCRLPDGVDRPPLVCGHVHPAAVIAGGGDRLKLACFWRRAPAPGIEAGALILPAFSRFAAGTRIRPAPGDNVFAIAPDRLVELAHP